MRNWGVLLAMLAVAVVNLPPLIDCWRSNRAGFIKTSELLAIYLLYCLLGGGLILWLASEAHPVEDSAWKTLQVTGVLLGFILYGALTLIRAAPSTARSPAWLMRFGLADHIVLVFMFGCLVAYLWL